MKIILMKDRQKPFDLNNSKNADLATILTHPLQADHFYFSGTEK